MSFMFKPLAYDDMRAVNRIKLPEGLCQRVLEDCGDIAAHILHAGGLPGKKTVIGVDGYIGAQFGALLDYTHARTCTRAYAGTYACMRAYTHVYEHVHTYS